MHHHGTWDYLQVAILCAAAWAGSYDQLFLHIGHNGKYPDSQPHYLLKEAPDRGDLMRIDVDLADAFATDPVTINDINYVGLVSRLDNGKQGSDELKLSGTLSDSPHRSFSTLDMTMTANGSFLTSDMTITAKCASSGKVALLPIKKVDKWFVDWRTDVKPTDWVWKQDCTKFTEISFEWRLADVAWAGTKDDLKLGFHRDVRAHDVLLFQDSSRGVGNRMKLRLKDIYGSTSVLIEQVNFFRIYSTPQSADASEDQWNFRGTSVYCAKRQC
ncbi:heat-labile enterotoxin IIB, A chain [Metarhizium guizhouense ARSEF 977]|uniref:Heat-labile enterotoxin IIB, A chain n=1 Tax=Metarhizium guizhouense (strain ARSEF 977) TaxID=1276136 RepID=A0A0B4GVD6_METGA|nr:heat-labile enterotoxin IIB, A chain [Metarhizium guizhouense ARSEF 977]